MEMEASEMNINTSAMVAGNRSSSAAVSANEKGSLGMDMFNSNISSVEKDAVSVATLATSKGRASASIAPVGRLSTTKQRSRGNTNSNAESPNYSSANAMAEGILRQTAEASTMLDPTIAARHTLSDMEVEAYTSWINTEFGHHDSRLQHLLPIPFEEHGNSLFKALASGLILCKLVNRAKPDTIDESTIIWTPPSAVKQLMTYHENLAKALEGAKKIGCQISNIGADDIIRGTPHLCSGLLWQLIKFALLANLGSTNSKAQESGLLAWFNDQLSKTTIIRRISNFTTDLADSECLLHVLNQIAPKKVTHTDIKNAISESDLTSRALKMLELADRIEARQFATGGSIVSGANKHMNIAFVATLYNQALLLKSASADIISEELDGLKAELSEAMNRNLKLNAENTGLKTGNTQVNNELIESREKNELLNSQISGQNRRINSLQEDSQRLVMDNEDLQKKLKAKQDESRSQINQIETALSADNVQLESTMQATTRTTTMQIKQLQAHEQHQTAEITKLSNELSFSKGLILQHERSLEDQRTIFADYQADMEKRTKDNIALIANLRNSKLTIESQVGELEGLKRGNEQLSTKLKTLKQDYQVLEVAADECKRLQTQLREKKESENELNNKIRSSVKESDSLKNRIQGLERLAQEKVTVDTALESSRRELKEIKSQLENVSQQKASLSTQERTLQQNNHSLTVQLDETSLQNASLQIESGRKGQIISSLQRKCTSLECECSDLKRERNNLEHLKTQLELDLSQTKKELQQHETRLSELYSVSDKSNRAMDEATQQLQARQAELDKLQTERNALLKQHEQDLSQHDALRNEISRCRDLLIATNEVKISCRGSTLALEKVDQGIDIDTDTMPLSTQLHGLLDNYKILIDSVEKYAKKITKLENAIGVLKDVNQIKSRKEVDQVKVDNTSLLMDKLMKASIR
ncbi:hypothetical protein SeLEV6574_g05803, partial [Synchytrium endobioticum]